MAIKIKVKPMNGISIPGIGHLAQGEHTVDLTAADLKDAEGISIVKASKVPAPK
jgi:hypothetical protein